MKKEIKEKKPRKDIKEIDNIIKTEKIDNEILYEQKIDGKHYFWILFLCSFIGYIIEVLWAFLRHGKFINRQGLVWGPFTIIYGLGAVMFIIVAKKWYKKNDTFLFLLCGLFGGILESVASLWQEMAFGTVSWSYTEGSFSLFGGRTSLVYMVFWGFLGILFVRAIYPKIIKLVNYVNHEASDIVYYVLLLFLCLNIVVSIIAVDRWVKRDEHIFPTNIVQEIIDDRFPDERMEKIYTNMQTIKK